MSIPIWQKHIRGLLFKDDSFEDAPYSTLGTCFLFSFLELRYIITAKHCMEDRKIDSLLIIPEPWKESTKHYPLSFQQPFCVEKTHPDKGMDTDIEDFIIYPCDQREYKDVPADLFYSWQPVSAEDFSKDARVFIAGYPGCEQGIEYEKGAYDSSPVRLEAESSIENECPHKYKVTLARSPIQDYNGFSGSPVFMARESDSPKIIGIVVRGTAESRVIHFIDIRLAVTLISYHLGKLLKQEEH